jgi:hypothetical protein
MMKISSLPETIFHRDLPGDLRMHREIEYPCRILAMVLADDCIASWMVRKERREVIDTVVEDDDSASIFVFEGHMLFERKGGGRGRGKLGGGEREERDVEGFVQKKGDQKLWITVQEMEIDALWYQRARGRER